MKIKIKRVYEEPEKEDGFRILVDRIWPRGLSKEKAKVDLWLKEIAPSTELRKYFGHKAEKWEEFRRRYLQELQEQKDGISQVREQMKEKNITLVYAAKDTCRNQAVVLLEVLKK